VVKTRRSSRIPDCSYSFDFHGAKLLIFCDISKFSGEFFWRKIEDFFDVFLAVSKIMIIFATEKL